MKKLIYMAGVALVMLASASCEKKETVKEAQSSVEKGEMVFTAAAKSGALKTTIASDGVTAVWSATDKLKVFTATDTQGSECSLTKGEGTSTAEFAGQCAKQGPWTAIYPSSVATGFSNGTITINMPEEQTYRENTFAQGAMPCVAYSETNTFEFNHSFGVLKLTLRPYVLGDNNYYEIDKIVVTDKGGAKLNGTFTVNPATGAKAIKSGSDGSNSVTLKCNKLRFNEEKEFWFVVPEGAFANGFNVKIYCANNCTDNFLKEAPFKWFNDVELSCSKANKIEAGKITEMPDPGSVEAFVARKIDGYYVVDMALSSGTYWALYDVEAENVVNHGKYFQWGDTNGFTSWRVGTPSEYKYIDDGHYTKYLEDGETLEPEDDAANVNWGGSWSMPTKEQWDELIDACDIEFYEDLCGSGVNAYMFISRHNGETLYFPIDPDHDGGEYWTSTSLVGAPSLPYAAYIARITEENPMTTMFPRYMYSRVRAVTR